MRLNIIVAKSENDVIGRDGDLPWQLSADLRHFKATTLGHPLVMGRKTHESIGRPLPGRRNIVVTRQPDYRASGCTVVDSLEHAIAAALAAAEVMIIGGATLYAAALPQAGRIYLTEVHARIAGDTHFPPIDRNLLREVARERHEADEKNDHDYSFVVLDRIA
ncbi:MAG: dihydrofolate reductase [Gammaproteobacteria bacterium]